MDALQSGEPLTIMLGGQSIQLQAEQSVKRGRVIKARQMAGPGERSITQQVLDYLGQRSPCSAKEIAEGIGFGRASVSSALTRFMNRKVSRVKVDGNTKWVLMNGKSKSNGTVNGSKRVPIRNRVLEYLEVNGPDMSPRIAVSLRLPRPKVTTALNSMLHQKLVARRGSKRASVWRVR